MTTENIDEVKRLRANVLQEKLLMELSDNRCYTNGRIKSTLDTLKYFDELIRSLEKLNDKCACS